MENAQYGKYMCKFFACKIIYEMEKCLMVNVRYSVNIRAAKTLLIPKNEFSPLSNSFT